MSGAPFAIARLRALGRDRVDEDRLCGHDDEWSDDQDGCRHSGRRHSRLRSLECAGQDESSAVQ